MPSAANMASPMLAVGTAARIAAGADSVMALDAAAF